MALRRFLFIACLLAFLLNACAGLTPTETLSATSTPNPPFEFPTFAPTDTPTPTVTPTPLVPNFEHIVIIVLENKEFGAVYPNPKMAYFNGLANSYTLLTQHYAVTHPSLPNYLAMIGGDTFGITFDCDSCFIQAPTLPDQIEASGRTWKTYQEDMPTPCYAQPYAGNYAIKHNPFLYFKPIRLDTTRCARSVVPFTQLSTDLSAGTLPNFIFITPDLCNDAHDCDIDVADDWLKMLMSQLQPALDSEGKPYLIIITWDEGQGDHSCCGLPEEAGGRIATVLVSPQVKNGFQDDTPYTHYSILKTIEEAWHLPYLGHSADAENVLITAPWK
ncbi:MAG TPA: alkaline phosphatase family protein [Anaerolineales bacterium]|jgi:phospholipase C|nr:alkaline phosphatase family protein [Anaerolineales bacterium]